MLYNLHSWEISSNNNPRYNEATIRGHVDTVVFDNLHYLKQSCQLCWYNWVRQLALYQTVSPTMSIRLCSEVCTVASSVANYLREQKREVKRYSTSLQSRNICIHILNMSVCLWLYLQTWHFTNLASASLVMVKIGRHNPTDGMSIFLLTLWWRRWWWRRRRSGERPTGFHEIQMYKKHADPHQSKLALNPKLPTRKVLSLDHNAPINTPNKVTI
jgi:hypothetical protein